MSFLPGIGISNDCIKSAKKAFCFAQGLSFLTILTPIVTIKNTNEPSLASPILFGEI